jgi:hypothetical protein
MNLVEECSEDTWAEAEKKWIKHYRELDVGLTNFTDGGDKGAATYGRLGKKNSQEHIAKTRAGRIGKPVKRSQISNERRAKGVRRYYDNNRRKVYQYALNGEYIKEWSSAKEAAEFLNSFPSGIRVCCKNEKGSSAGYQWRYNFYKELRKYEKLNHMKNKKHSKEVLEKISKGMKGKPWTQTRRDSQNNI